jgi:hypothetical protein
MGKRKVSKKKDCGVNGQHNPSPKGVDPGSMPGSLLFLFISF